MISTVGIKISYLREFIETKTAEGFDFVGKTTKQIQQEIIIPETAEFKCSYCDQLKAQGNIDAIGEANVLISHALSDIFLYLVEKLENSRNFYFNDSKIQTHVNETIIWLDIFSFNQHLPSISLPPSFFATSFRDVITKTHSTVFVLTPSSVDRTWCIWEIFCTMDCKCKFRVALPNDFRQYLNIFWKVAWKGINSQASQCADLYAKQLIDQNIMDSCGFIQVNQIVKRLILMDLIQSFIRRIASVLLWFWVPCGFMISGYLIKDFYGNIGNPITFLALTVMIRSSPFLQTMKTVQKDSDNTDSQNIMRICRSMIALGQSLNSLTNMRDFSFFEISIALFSFLILIDHPVWWLFFRNFLTPTDRVKLAEDGSISWKLWIYLFFFYGIAGGILSQLSISMWTRRSFLWNLYVCFCFLSASNHPIWIIFRIMEGEQNVKINIPIIDCEVNLQVFINIYLIFVKLMILSLFSLLFITEIYLDQLHIGDFVSAVLMWLAIFRWILPNSFPKPFDSLTNLLSNEMLFKWNERIIGLLFIVSITDTSIFEIMISLVLFPKHPIWTILSFCSSNLWLLSIAINFVLYSSGMISKFGLFIQLLLVYIVFCTLRYLLTLIHSCIPIGLKESIAICLHLVAIIAEFYFLTIDFNIRKSFRICLLCYRLCSSSNSPFWMISNRFSQLPESYKLFILCIPELLFYIWLHSQVTDE